MHISSSSPSTSPGRCLRFIYNGRKKIQSSNNSNVLSHLAQKKTTRVSLWDSQCPLEYLGKKQNYSKESRFPSKESRFPVPGLWNQAGLVDTCILIGLAKASQDLLTYYWSRRIEALARAAQELYIHIRYMQVWVWHVSISMQTCRCVSKSSFYTNSENILIEWINYNILQWHSNSTSSLGCTWKLCWAGSQATNPYLIRPTNWTHSHARAVLVEI